MSQMFLIEVKATVLVDAEDEQWARDVALRSYLERPREGNCGTPYQWYARGLSYEVAEVKRVASAAEADATKRRAGAEVAGGVPIGSPGLPLRIPEPTGRRARQMALDGEA